MRLAIQSILDFWTGCVSTGTAGSFYISGKPGTGKTATLREVRGLMQKQDRSVRIPPPLPPLPAPLTFPPSPRRGAVYPLFLSDPRSFPASVFTPRFSCVTVLGYATVSSRVRELHDSEGTDTVLQGGFVDN